MWRFLFKRLWANTLLYTLFLATTLTLIQTPTPSTKIILLLAPTILYLNSLARAILSERKLSRLGHHAPAVGSWAPYGLDTLFWAMYYFSHHRNHEFWYYVFGFNTNVENPWTVEEITVGERIVFTADEENVKAVLATQFADFGKGEQFRKEWRDFLGLSEFLLSREEVIVVANADVSVGRYLHHGWREVA